MKIFIGNCPWSAGEKELAGLFAAFGKVEEVVLPVFDDGHRRSFAFVLMEDGADALRAILALDKTEFLGRSIDVSIAAEKKNRFKGRR